VTPGINGEISLTAIITGHFYIRLGYRCHASWADFNQGNGIAKVFGFNIYSINPALFMAGMVPHRYKGIDIFHGLTLTILGYF